MPDRDSDSDDDSLTTFSEEATRTSKENSKQIIESLDQQDVKSFVHYINIIFDAIPSLHRPKKDEKSEAFYHSNLHTALGSLGIDPQSEVNVGRGRIDMVIESRKT